MDTSSSAVSFKAENALKILTPWWNVVLKYITTAIVTIALGTLPIQAAKDSLACLVVIDCPNSTTGTATPICEISNKSEVATFTNSACYSSLDIFSQFFYVVQLGEALVLLFATNIWAVLNPKTALTLSHFISIVSECYDSIGTPEQISRLLDSSREEPRLEHHGVAPVEEGRPTREMSPVVSRRTSSKENIEHDPDLDNESKSRIKTIYHKVRKFSDAQIQKKSLYFLYLFQQILQVFFACAIIVINAVFFRSFQQEFKCFIRQSEFLPMKYEYIACYRYIASLYTVISWVFIGFVCFYFLISIAVFIFMRTSANIPVFRDSNDLDFLCFLLNQYSTFQYERFALFDSRVKKRSTGKTRSSAGSSYKSFPGFQKLN